MASLINKPTFIENKNYRFLIMDAPTDDNLGAVVEILKKKQCVAVCRACEPSYNSDLLTENGIRVLDVPFPDGDPPPQNVIDTWLSLVDEVLNRPPKDDNDKPCIAVHCVAGLGRAPVLVAISLVESGMDPLDAIEFIRKKRRGAINARQLQYLESYQRKSKEKGGGCCIVQ